MADEAATVTLWRSARIATCDERMTTHERGAMLTRGPRIAWVGDEADLPAGHGASEVVDLENRWVTPGLVDCHTHLVFAGQRAAEFARRTSGESYAALAREGGGILSTMRATRAASDADLFDQSRARLESLLAEGVTTVEIKSGYGLTRDDEAKMLRVARRLATQYPVTVATTLLAAHALPPEFAQRADAYIDTVANDWLPALHREGLVDAVDAFCEDIGFTAGQCERLFRAADALAVRVKLHAEQLANVGGSRVAARHRALSVDHLEFTKEDDVVALAAARTVAVLLPLAFYTLAETQRPPIDAFRRHGVPMAVASDCNPGSAPGASILLSMNMSRRLFGLTGREALLGVTRHAALALDMHARCGTLAAGLDADAAVWSIDTLDELGYWAGFNPCHAVIRHGELVSQRAA